MNQIAAQQNQSADEPSQRLPSPISDAILIEVLEQIASLTFLHAVHFQLSTTAHDIEGWDSLSHTIFMLDIEERFGIQIPIEETYPLKNVGELITFLRPYIEKAH
jgi:acyl carrier protein